MKNITLIALCTFLTSCTITMMNTSTSGRAQDTIDAESDAKADVAPQVTVPVSAI